MDGLAILAVAFAGPALLLMLARAALRWADRLDARPTYTTADSERPTGYGRYW